MNKLNKFINWFLGRADRVAHEIVYNRSFHEYRDGIAPQAYDSFRVQKNKKEDKKLFNNSFTKLTTQPHEIIQS